LLIDTHAAATAIASVARAHPDAIVCMTSASIFEAVGVELHMSVQTARMTPQLTERGVAPRRHATLRQQRRA